MFLKNFTKLLPKHLFCKAATNGCFWKQSWPIHWYKVHIIKELTAQCFGHLTQLLLKSVCFHKVYLKNLILTFFNISFPMCYEHNASENSLFCLFQKNTQEIVSTFRKNLWTRLRNCLWIYIHEKLLTGCKQISQSNLQLKEEGFNLV